MELLPQQGYLMPFDGRHDLKPALRAQVRVEASGKQKPDAVAPLGGWD